MLSCEELGFQACVKIFLPGIECELVVVESGVSAVGWAAAARLGARLVNQGQQLSCVHG